MRFIFLAAILVLTFQPAARAADDPAAAADAFYAVYRSQQPHGGLPDATVRLHYSSVLSPRLNKQLADAAAAQGRLAAKVRNAPPMLEGDIFSSLFEGASAWKVGACQGDAKAARCPVALSFTPPPSQNAKAPKPASWSDTLILVYAQQGWKVDDVVYDAGFQFGNTGKLSDMLQMVIAAGPR
jgi:hypothetical protein